MAYPLTNPDDVHALLRKELGEEMHERLKKHHALEDDIADLIGGELSPRNFGAALKETIGVARDSLPDAMPPGGARAFIMLKGNEMDALVDGIVSGIAGKDSGRYLG